MSADAPPPLRVPAGIASLDPEARERIERLVAEAERRQDREAAEAAATTLELVPRLLRGVTRRVLGL